MKCITSIFFKEFVWVCWSEDCRSCWRDRFGTWSSHMSKADKLSSHVLISSHLISVLNISERNQNRTCTHGRQLLMTLESHLKQKRFKVFLDPEDGRMRAPETWYSLDGAGAKVRFRQQWVNSNVTVSAKKIAELVGMELQEEMHG